jgi:uncharacterized membrane protein
MRRFCWLPFLLLAFAASAYAQFTYASLDFPGGTLTTSRGINNHGEIVGAYRIVPPRHALLIRHGQYIPLAPNTILGTTLSEAYKTNDRGDVVGAYFDDAGLSHGFFLSKNGAVTTLDFPGADDTYARGINESGTVVGQWDLLDANGNALIVHGFLWKDGTFTQFDYPGAGDTYLFGINARGDLVGGWDPAITSPLEHGFVCSNQQCSSFDVPVVGAPATQAEDINAQAQISGAYADANGAVHGFLKTENGFAFLDVPGAVLTNAWGINAAGQIVGNYNNADGSVHGFLAQRSTK